MVLEYGDTSKLTGLPWYMVEVRSEHTVEEVLRRIGKAIPGIFREEPMQLFIPLNRRDLDTFEMSFGSYLIARSTAFHGLYRLKSLTGVTGLVTANDCGHASKAVPLEDAYVQKLIAAAQAIHAARPEGIVVRSFVRVLDGQMRDFCGRVLAVEDGKATVRIKLLSGDVRLTTPIHNLINLSHVPRSQQVFYYCSALEGVEL